MVAGATALLGCGACLAQTAPSPSTAAPLRVGIAPVFPPMIFKEGKEVAGIEADLAQALGRYLRRPVQFVEVDFSDLLEGLNAGRFDIAMSSISVTEARRFRAAFCNPYLQIGQMMLVRADDQYKYVLGDAAPGKTKIGLKRGTTSDFFAQQEFPKWKRKYYESGEPAAKDLLKEKIDLFIGDSPLVWYLAGAYEGRGLTVVPRAFTVENLAWGVRRSDTELLESANAFLKKARESGEFDRILHRWIPKFQ